jgi:hypothetical protein
MRSLCALLLLVPAAVSAATLFSAGITTPSGSQANAGPEPVSVRQPRTACVGLPPGAGGACQYAASGAAGLSLAASAEAVAQAGGNPAPTFSVSTSASANASFSGYDVVLSGPSGQSTLTSLNLAFDGAALMLGIQNGLGTASLNIGTSMTVANSSVTDGGGITVTQSTPPRGSGLLSGWETFSGIPFPVGTSSLMVEAGDIVTVGLSLSGRATCSTVIQPVIQPRFAFCPAVLGVNSFSFSRSGPVFDLPAGWTANSVDGTIVNNVFIPEPSTALLVLAGLVGLVVRRARLAAPL